LEVQENRLDFKWICSDGIIRDQFSMMKDVNKKSEIRIKKGESITLKASFVGTHKWSNKETGRTITVMPVRTTTYTVRDQQNYLKDNFKIIVTK
jgi:hypothetical protein